MSEKKTSLELMKKILEDSFHEILGKENSDLMGYSQPGDGNLYDFNTSDTKNWWIPLQVAEHVLTDRFHPVTAKGLMIRIGRASLNHLRRYSDYVSELGSLENRLKPVSKKFDYSLNLLADFFSNDHVLFTVISPEKMRYVWQIKFEIGKSKDGDLFPYYFFGLLEEFCNWLDARKNYQMGYGAENNNSGLEEIYIEINEAQ